MYVFMPGQLIRKEIIKIREEINKIEIQESSCCGASEKNLTSVHEDADSIPGLTQWRRIQCGFELWCSPQMQLRPALLWLWCKLAAVALI